MNASKLAENLGLIKSSCMGVKTAVLETQEEIKRRLQLDQDGTVALLKALGVGAGYLALYSDTNDSLAKY